MENSTISNWQRRLLVIDNTQPGITESSGISELSVGYYPGVIPEKESYMMT